MLEPSKLNLTFFSILIYMKYTANLKANDSVYYSFQCQQQII
jgi:hypothetical protein